MNDTGGWSKAATIFVPLACVAGLGWWLSRSPAELPLKIEPLPPSVASRSGDASRTKATEGSTKLIPKKEVPELELSADVADRPPVLSGDLAPFPVGPPPAKGASRRRGGTKRHTSASTTSAKAKAKPGKDPEEPELWDLSGYRPWDHSTPSSNASTKRVVASPSTSSERSSAVKEERRGRELLVSRRAERGSSSQSPRAKASSAVSLNRASLDELMLLPGIGPSLARRIADARTQLGGFHSINDLLRVSGIGPTKFARLRPYVTL